jgi:hypothetical protein
MKSQDVMLILNHKPSVHKLCSGAFIQETIQLKDNVFAVKAVFSDESEYVAKYVIDICGGLITT